MMPGGRLPASPSSRLAANAHCGFTLIEVLVVLTIVAVAMTAAPSLMAGLRGARLRSATDDMATVLRTLHEQAIGANKTTELTLDPVNRVCALSTERAVRPLPAAVEGIAFQGDVSIRPGQVQNIQFYPDGSATAGTLLIRGGGREYGLTIDWMTGRVRHRE